jgi:hypothetical protein
MAATSATAATQYLSPSNRQIEPRLFSPSSSSWFEKQKKRKWLGELGKPSSLWGRLFACVFASTEVWNMARMLFLVAASQVRLHADMCLHRARAGRTEWLMHTLNTESLLDHADEAIAELESQKRKAAAAGTVACTHLMQM